MDDQQKLASKFGIHQSLLKAVNNVIKGDVQEEENIHESAGSRPQDKTAGENNPVMQGASKVHNCAKQVTHEEYGIGQTIFGEHAEPDRYGHVAWYDVQFDHGIEERMPVSEMTVVKSESHGNHKKK